MWRKDKFKRTIFLRPFGFMRGTEGVENSSQKDDRKQASVACLLGQAWRWRIFNFRRDMGKQDETLLTFPNEQTFYNCLHTNCLLTVCRKDIDDVLLHLDYYEFVCQINSFSYREDEQTFESKPDLN